MKKIAFLFFLCLGYTYVYAQSGAWTWMKGSPYVVNGTSQFVVGGEPDSLGSYGIKGMPDSSNVPCPRSGMISWKDLQGNFWFYGGSGYNDMWKYNIASNSWTWMHGPQYYTDTAGNAGTMGVPSASNVPHSKKTIYSWYDKAHENLWLWQSDDKLWRYQVATNMWTWTANMPSQNIVSFGTRGVAAASNNPGNISGAATWCDTSGNLFLCGGVGLNPAYYIDISLDHSGNFKQLNTNDVWKYNTDSNMWTWLKGDSLKDGFTMNWYGNFTFGTLGIEDSNNHMMRGRDHSVWEGHDGMVYLSLGRTTYHAAQATGRNYIFRYNPQTNNWTWIFGGNSPLINNYCDTNTIPLERFGGALATDVGACSNDLLWRFGGSVVNINENTSVGYCVQCQTTELYAYQPSNNTWKWVNGLKGTPSTPLNAGTKGVPDVANRPDNVTGAAMWNDANGNLWLFGGYSHYRYPDNAFSILSDLLYQSNVLWRYQPDNTCVASGHLSTPAKTTLLTCYPYIDSTSLQILSNFSNVSITPSTGVIFNIDTSLLVFKPLSTTTYTLTALNNSCNVYDTLVFTIQVETTQYTIISTNFNGYDSLTVVPSAQAYQWINCNTNALLQNDTNQSLVVYQNGLYAAIVFNGNCFDTTNCISVNNINSINNVNNPTLITISPNPSQSVFHISSSIVFERADIKVLSSTGSEIISKTIVNKNDFTIDISSNARGLYYVYIKDGERVFHAKLLKE